MSVVDRDLGYGEVMDALGEVEGVEGVVVGIDAVAHPDQAVYGAVHEFGSTHHRESAWLRGSADATEDHLGRAIGEGLARAIDGRGVEAAEQGLYDAGAKLRDRARRGLAEAGLVDSGALKQRRRSFRSKKFGSPRCCEFVIRVSV